ncbi:SDR family NAD(P)-dependent oxidoreductase [Nitrosopumilus sp. S6]
MNSILKNKNILVTGGSGSIGQEIVKKAINDGAKFVRVFSNDENGLYEMEQTFTNKKIDYVVGDIRNFETVNSAVKGIDIIFHTAALKHVDRCELNPFETFTVNIIGTNNLVKAAENENVEKVISISSDKAVNPIGVMGATKLLGEKLLSAESFHTNSKTIFASVRFGNVFHTRGSILPKIENQIKNGGPITLTDKRMKRFFMTKMEAVDLIVNATNLAKGGEIFILKMPLLYLNDLFEVMKKILAPKYGYDEKQIKTKVTGIRPGEKLTEYLLTDFEMEHVLETKDFFILPSLFKPLSKYKYPNAKKPKNIFSYFNEMEPLNISEITKILKTVYEK